MSKSPEAAVEEPTPEPSVGIVVVGNDPEVCASVANMVRAGLAFMGGIETIPMERFVDTESFIDTSGHRDAEFVRDEAESMWFKMRSERPGIEKLIIPIEIHDGSAVGKESVLIEGSIVTDSLRLASSTRYTRTIA